MALHPSARAFALDRLKLDRLCDIRSFTPCLARLTLPNCRNRRLNSRPERYHLRIPTTSSAPLEARNENQLLLTPTVTKRMEFTRWRESWISAHETDPGASDMAVAICNCSGARAQYFNGWLAISCICLVVARSLWTQLNHVCCTCSCICRKDSYLFHFRRTRL